MTLNKPLGIILVIVVLFVGLFIFFRIFTWLSRKHFKKQNFVLLCPKSVVVIEKLRMEQVLCLDFLL